MSPFKDFDLDIVKVTATSGISPRTEDPQTDACGTGTTEGCVPFTRITCVAVTCGCIYSVDACDSMESKCGE